MLLEAISHNSTIAQPLQNHVPNNLHKVHLKLLFKTKNVASYKNKNKTENHNKTSIIPYRAQHQMPQIHLNWMRRL